VLDAAAVDERAVLAAEVFEGGAGGVDGDHRVPSRDRAVVDVHARMRVASDHIRAAHERRLALVPHHARDDRLRRRLFLPLKRVAVPVHGADESR
jgi:hypothetical protein